MKPTASTPLDCESQASVLETERLVDSKEEVCDEKTTYQKGPTYPDISRLQITELGHDGLKYRLVTETWDASTYKFPSR